MKILANKPTITRKELEGVLDCLINDELTSGESVKKFESTIAKLIGVKYALATHSLTSSYHCAYHALEIGEGDEVIIPSYFNQAPLSALLLTGAKPIPVDTDADSLFPSIDAVKQKVTDRTKAIVLGHTFGFHLDCTPYKELKIPIIEDISHAIGTEIEDNAAGRSGSITVISFDPSAIITTGKGGMTLTGNSKLYSRMRDYRGGNDTLINMDYTMTDLQGAMGISQLVRLQKFLGRRREIARIYHNALKNTSHRTPYLYNESAGYQSFPVMFDGSTEKVGSYWKKSGIEIICPISTPLHTLLKAEESDYPNSRRLSRKLFSVPIYPSLSKRNIEKISKAIAGFI